MTGNQVVPDTEDFNVAAMAVAWEVVKLAMGPGTSGGGVNAVKLLTNEVVKTYLALRDQVQLT